MGYGYGYTSSGRLALACDNCGGVGGVRKRNCTHMVLGHNLRCPGGQRPEMHYCYAPALCGPCFQAIGGNREIHKDCAEAARLCQMRDNATQRKLDAGEWMVISARGDWHERCPAGMVLVTFSQAGYRNHRDLLVPSQNYNPQDRPCLSDYPEAVEVEQLESGSKEVSRR